MTQRHTYACKSCNRTTRAPALYGCPHCPQCRAPMVVVQPAPKNRKAARNKRRLEARK